MQVVKVCSSEIHSSVKMTNTVFKTVDGAIYSDELIVSHLHHHLKSLRFIGDLIPTCIRKLRNLLVLRYLHINRKLNPQTLVDPQRPNPLQQFVQVLHLQTRHLIILVSPRRTCHDQ
ncbi:hypothetical protein ZOSMA_5G01000 [Zostera marina]|uniref:Uncharacterized protein n=1 Tax=Zostera marina TaxID=29655 RepID=A0A0K9NWA0_ZOSMR|nr:hypothetical protein ZOSMA_5G01000 [Zostera marina]